MTDDQHPTYTISVPGITLAPATPPAPMGFFGRMALAFASAKPKEPHVTRFIFKGMAPGTPVELNGRPWLIIPDARGEHE